MMNYAIKREPKRAGIGYRQRQVFAETPAFEAAAERLVPLLRRAAVAISHGDWQLAQDMEQEALIELWEVDATRFEAADEKVLKKMLFKRMRVVRYREKKASLAALRDYVNPDEVTEEGVMQRSAEIRRRLEREVG